ncbi:MAG: leucine-rich repeat protein [Acetatifactor sp.]
MQERRVELAGGSLRYEIREGKALVTSFSGTASEVVLPGQLEGCPVTAVGKKAFLSRKQLRRITLPGTLEEIGDWAFAYCSSLQEVRLPGKKLYIGKTIFLECGDLQRIEICPLEVNGGIWAIDDNAPGIGKLLAAAVVSMDGYYLLDMETAGSEEWLRKWDSRLFSVLHGADTEGYSKQVLCGEEDYGSTDLTSYMSEKRKGKVRLALLRLLHPMNLSDGLREELEQYLLTHTAGCETDEAWQVIRKEHGDDRAYYSLFQKLGCVNSGNLDRVLADIGSGYPEMKAFFLSGSTGSQASDFFEDLEL